MNKFGWSLPPGCGRLPGEEPQESISLRCRKCGRFIKMQVTRSEPWEDSYINDDLQFGVVGEKVILAAGMTDYYACSLCGEVSDPIPVFA